MEAVSKFDLFSLILCVEFAGIALRAFPQKACRLWSCVFVHLFVFLSFNVMAEGKLSVCGKGLGD